jgi:hypothetical protein
MRNEPKVLTLAVSKIAMKRCPGKAEKSTVVPLVQRGTTCKQRRLQEQELWPTGT